MWTYIRDTIIVNDAFTNEVKAELKAKQMPKESTLFFAARQIKHAPGYTFALQEYHVVLLADEYDCGGFGAGIDVSGSPGDAGAPGAPGKAGYASAASASDRPGGAGHPGGRGGDGMRGMNLTLYCGRVQSFIAASKGGAGGVGGAGGTGGKGGSGIRITPPSHEREPVGTAGGNGARGGDGGAGGAGGNVSVFYVTHPLSGPLQNPFFSVLSGGAGGKAGKAGAGGVGGPHSAAGKAGSPGSAGKGGSDGVSTVQQLTEADLMQRLRNGTGPSGLAACVREWAAYRMRMGDYYARAFSPTKPETAGFLRLAAHEFRFAYMIDPVAFATARDQVALVSGGLTPLGFRRDHYVIPDFPTYEQAFLNYAPLVTPLVSNATQLLLHTQTLETTRRMLRDRMENIRSQVEIINTEKAEVELELNKAQAALSAADGRLADLQTQIAAKRAEITAARLELGANFIISVAEAIGAVVAVVAAVYTGGTSVMAFAGLLTAAQETWGNLKLDEATGQPTYNDKPLAEFVTWTDKDGKFAPQATPEAKQLAGGLKEVIRAGQTGVKATLDLIDKARVLADIGSAKVNGSLEGQLNALLKRSAELAFDQAQMKVDVEIAKLRGKVLDQRAAQAQADLTAAQALHDSLSNDNATLGRVVQLLMRRAQEYMTYLARFRFLAVRSLDIYTLRDHTAAQVFDIGFVHPDLEARAYMTLARGDATASLDLMQAYLDSWSRLPSIVALRDEYLAYAKSPQLVTQPQTWNFAASSEPVALAPRLALSTPTIGVIAGPVEGPPIVMQRAVAAQMLAQFRQFHTVDFDLPLADLFAKRFECKIDTVAVALVGATASDAFIPCVLVHRGEAQAKRLDGTVVRTAFPPLALPIAASKVDDGGLAPAGQAEAFWGRSPAARWRLTIEPQAVATSHVDLSGLTKIVLTIRYKTLLGGVALRVAPLSPPEEVSVGVR